MKITIKHCKVELVFDIWDNEIDVNDVPGIIERAIDKAGYSCSDSPSVVEVTETEEEV